ncbi:nuclear pore complex protein Nup205 [Dendroctonus ponderosae]|uniref:Nuclear pore complex protein Nup205 n=1 Tax=Dendroctonus ponderosae TaxID=77166 RepID=A0AAR5NXT5_DENPD|nr:nuclear pore complex protein Nup205 [Dendroctonus ponderosae]
MSLIPTEDVWNSLKELRTTVWKYLNQPHESDLPSADFENILRKHKQHFFNLLHNPPKNAKKREELKSGMVNGMYVKGLGSQELSKELYQETIILSDMFDLNELVALDLLCTAQIQMPYYPGLARGLVAVLLYYDGRKALLSTLLCLVQARNGIQWRVNVKPELSRFVTDYTDQLLDGGILIRVLELLTLLDWGKEYHMLQENLALGDAKHRRQITDLFNDIRTILADVMFSWATQCGLPKDCTIALLNHLKQVKIEFEASGYIDDVILYLQMALLSAIDLSIFHTREDGEEAVQSLPILSDTTFISDVANELLPPCSEWACEGLQALTTFGMSVCLASLRVLPQNYVYQDAINKEDVLVDMAIEMNVFTFLHNIILESKTLYQEQFLYKRMHNLLTDFVVYMYPKVKDLRMKANEVSRTLQVYIREGLEAPASLPRYFEYLLLSIGKFYTNNILDGEYNLNWWSPIEINPDNSLNIRIPPRSVALFKLIKLAGDILPATLFVPFIKMLSGLSGTAETAKYCFNLLKQSGVHLSHTLTWDHFFQSFSQYFNNLRQEAPPQADTVYRLRPGYHKGVNPQELEGLQAVLLLIRTVADQDQFVRLAICEHPGWTPLNVLLGLVSCSVPLPFKADLLLTLASLSKSVSNANRMWNNLEASQILVTIPTTSSYVPKGIETELDEIESRLEEYPLTRAVLCLLDTLTNFEIPRTLGAGPRKPGFEPYFDFIINSVFLKFNSRSYRNIVEKWEVAHLCLKLFEKFLNQYDPMVRDFRQQTDVSQFNCPPGYHLMIQLNNNTEALNIVLDMIDEGSHYFESYVSFPGLEKVKDCTLCCLNIILRTLYLFNTFLSKLTVAAGDTRVLSSVGKLLMAINRRSGKPDHCINIAKYVCYQQYLPKHALVAVKILKHITSTVISHNTFMSILTTSENTQEIIKNGFIQSLESQHDATSIGNSTKTEILGLMKQCLGYNSPNFTHFLMGFDLMRDVSKTEFQYPGVMGFPRTCIHSLLSILESVISKTVQPPSVAILESCYHLVYLLASNPKTSTPFLRFIRLNKMFFISHLKECKTDMNKSPKNLRKISWLMKTLAVEMKVGSNWKQVTYLKQLTTFLGNVPTGEEGQDTMFLYQSFNIELKNLHGVPEIVDPTTGAQVTDNKILQKYADACESLVEFVNAWRQVVEVVVTCIPLEILNAREQQVFSITLLLCLLRKVVRSDLLPEVYRLLSGSVLLIMNNIKRHYLKEKGEFNVVTYYLGSLKDILDSLVRWIMTSDVVDGELRINLYAALVTFLQMTSVDMDIHQDRLNNTVYVPTLDGPRSNINPKDRQIKLSTDIIDNFGEKLMEILCHDCLGGQEVCKILAMSSYSHLMALSVNNNWAIYISAHGFLRHIIQSILESDGELKAMLEPGFGNVKPLYLYLAKMVLLTRLASSKMGAQMLLEQKLLGVFSNMSVYRLHPEVSTVWKGEEILDNFLPAPEQQYLQMFMPALDLCNAILTTLGTENQSAITQIMYFLFSHQDVIELILRSGDTDLSATSLKELAVLTSVVSRAASNNMINVLENPNIVLSNRAQLYRLQKLMLSLLPKFMLSEDNIKTLLTQSNAENTSYPTSDRLLYALQVATNVLWYARNIIANNDVEHGEVGVLFYPSLCDPQGNIFSKKILGHSSEQEPSLGLVVQQLIYTVTYIQQRKVTFDLLARKLQDVPDMNSMDLREFIEDHLEMADLSVKRERAFEIISEKLEKKKKEMEYCSFIIENALYLIWAHLDYFMLRATPNPRSTVYIHPNSIGSLDATVPASSECIWKVSNDVIVSLKRRLISIFNDSFSEQLLEVSQDRTEADRGFTEALLRKCKRLIQFVRAL